MLNSQVYAILPMMATSSNPYHNKLTFKNTILCNLTKSIQSVSLLFVVPDHRGLIQTCITSQLTFIANLKCQQFYVNNNNQPLTNSDYQVHELVQQFDNIFIYGLKQLEDSYWMFIINFTHKDVINEINRLLNVTSNFGRARAWLYHALNDCLMESYLKCFSENRKTRTKSYLKSDGSFINDEQMLNLLQTLVCGLENVQFALFNDVSYLDHSCWPTHLQSKRNLIYSAQLGNKNNLENSISQSKSQSSPLMAQSKSFHGLQSATAATSSSLLAASLNTTTKPSSSKRNGKSSRRRPTTVVNNVSLDSTSSTNFSDLYALDMNDESDATSIGLNVKTKKSKANCRNDRSTPITTTTTTSDDDNDDDGYSLSVEESRKIDKEIIKLRKEAASLSQSLNNGNMAGSPRTDTTTEQQRKQSTLTLIDHANLTENQNLFNRKLEDLEHYSDIIETATCKMDEFVSNMTKVYESFDENYSNAALFHNSMQSSVNEQKNDEDDDNDMTGGVYDLNQLNAALKSNEDSRQQETTSVDTKSQMSAGSTSSSNNKTEVITSFDETINTDIKQELKIDNNTKLTLLMDIFQNDQNEEFIKMYHVTRGHTQGEIEEIYLLLTTHALYILLKNEQKATKNSHSMFSKDAIINHVEIDYIEIALNDQAFHIVCVNRRKQYWLTTGSRSLTENIMANIQLAREQTSPGKSPQVSILRDATTQKIAIKKFIANQENSSPQDIEIKTYSLVFWEDQASSSQQLIQKNGYLMFMLKSSSTQSNIFDSLTGSTAHEWKKAYFVLRNDTLSQYKSHTDKRPYSTTKLNGEDFSGCRKSSNTSRAHTIELILSNSTTLYLSSKNESESSEWLQAFCKTISLGNMNSDASLQTCLPCSCILTANMLYTCHEDLSTNFYRLLDSTNLQEITSISIDRDCACYCIIYADSDTNNKQKQKYWLVFFVDESERNSFLKAIKETWEALFQIQFLIDNVKNVDLQSHCLRTVELINSTWDNESVLLNKEDNF